jgi:hypothetical protein
VKQLSENERMERGDYLRDRAKDERAEETAQQERLKLCAEYSDLTGRELPEHIRNLPLNRLREALRQARTGVVFGEPKQPKAAEDCSLADWDRQDDKNGNAYS